MSNVDSITFIDRYLKVHEEYIFIENKINTIDGSGYVYDLVLENYFGEDEKEEIEILTNLFKVFKENNVSIRSFKSDECNLCDESMQLIIDNLRELNITKLKLENEENISFQKWRNLFQKLPKTNITEVNLQGCNLDADTLETLRESYNNLDENENIALEKLDLSNSVNEEKHVNFLSLLKEILTHHKSNITNFVYNNYSFDQLEFVFEMLIEILPNLNKLQTIDISMHNYDDDDLEYYTNHKEEILDEEIFYKLAKILKDPNCTLREINLSNILMTNKSIEILAEATAYVKVYNKIDININLNNKDIKEVLYTYSSVSMHNVSDAIIQNGLIGSEKEEYFNRIKSFKELEYIQKSRINDSAKNDNNKRTYTAIIGDQSQNEGGSERNKRYKEGRVSPTL